jgi:streptogramin lyase
MKPFKRSLRALLAVAVALVAYAIVGMRVAPVDAQKATELQGLGTVSGTVTASKPFKAAQVYLHSTDRRRQMEYMVYTQAGAFKAVALFPGNYQLTVKARGLESDPQPIVVKPGNNPAVTVAMHNAADANQHPSSVDPALSRTANGVLPPKQEVALASYDEIYPAGAGRNVLETLCMNCHGENYFPIRPRSAAGWRTGLDNMMGKALAERDKVGFGDGTLAGSVSNFRLGVQDRKDVLEYLAKNFGLDKKPRAVRTDKEVPLDEAQLARAQYIEYYVLGGSPEKTAASATVASDSESASGGVAGVRIVMQVQIDSDGNRWAVDRGIPSRLVQLDPRTGEQKLWELPDKRAGVHELIIDRKGVVWVPEFGRTADGRVEGGGTGSELTSRLIGFNPKTQKWEHAIDPDPENVIRAVQKGPLMGSTVDSRGNIYMNWMLTGAISKYDPTTKKATAFRIPTPGAVPYGQAIDPFDNVWVSEWNGGKLGRFNTKTNTWTEFTPPFYPANLRRGPESDAEGNIWTGIWAAGNRPGMIARLDQRTGNWTTWEIPYRGAQPYEASVDKDGNIWFPDVNERRPDRPTVVGRFNPRDQTFTFYPRPQFAADSTRVSHAEDGSVHYSARYGSAKDTSAFGVLYPDKDKITTLAPRMLNSAPGYAFKVGTN